MGKDTKISWCDSTVNPVVGCDGCELHSAGQPDSHCYAAVLVGRYASLRGWPASFDKPEFFAGRIEQACRWSDLAGKDRAEKPWLNGYPRTIFLGDLADVFSESLPPDWLAPFLSMMERAPHIWIICTKRPKAASRFFNQHGCPKNFWLLTTVTSAATMGRVRDLECISAPVLGVSYEPALGPIVEAITAYLGNDQNLGWINWVICGGESGQNARPMRADWARAMRDSCTAAGVPFFFKQWGEWRQRECVEATRLDPPGSLQYFPEIDATFGRAGKKDASPILDGREWKQMPEVRR